jgi:CMP-N-acetylneuraminic acid synthetase
MIAILPLRKGSKRLKNKNILKIKKLMLYEYILKTLLDCKKIHKIIISTDIKFFFQKQFPKKIILHKRPINLRDNCNMNMVILDIINSYNFSDDQNFIQVHATSPLIKKESLNRGINQFKKNKKFDSLFSVTNTQKRIWRDLKNKIIPFNHNLKDEPTTQNLKNFYEENSGFYIFSKKSFLKNYNRIGNKPNYYLLGKIESIDIDDIEDFQIAKSLIK